MVQAVQASPHQSDDGSGAFHETTTTDVATQVDSNDTIGDFTIIFTSDKVCPFDKLKIVTCKQYGDLESKQSAYTINTTKLTDKVKYKA